MISNGLNQLIYSPTEEIKFLKNLIHNYQKNLNSS